VARLGAEHIASRGCELQEGAEEAAPPVRAYPDEGGRAAVLAAGGEALDQPQRHQQQRRRDTDRVWLGSAPMQKVAPDMNRM